MYFHFCNQKNGNHRPSNVMWFDFESYFVGKIIQKPTICCLPFCRQIAETPKPLSCRSVGYARLRLPWFGGQKSFKQREKLQHKRQQWRSLTKEATRGLDVDKELLMSHAALCSKNFAANCTAECKIPTTACSRPTQIEQWVDSVGRWEQEASC